MSGAKTVVAMHDLSSVGRCALTVAIPVLAAMGVQPIPAPTAVLSAHTAFPEFVSRDLTEYLGECLNEWERMNLQFDCVYTGYLADARQTEMALDFIGKQGNAKIVVDPVLGDDGQMYRALPKEMPQAMRRLCSVADLITPNLTEAALLTGEDYPEGAIGEEALESMLRKLRSLGANTVLITGVVLGKTHSVIDKNAPLGTQLGDMNMPHVNAWMGADNQMHIHRYEPVHAAFPGTGDLFASVVAGAITIGKTLEKAIEIATQYTALAMRHTVECKTTPVYGVQLEQTLPALISMLDS